MKSHPTALSSERPGGALYTTLLVFLLILVVAAFLVSPIKQLLIQEQQMRELKAGIEREHKRQEELEELIARWDDPDFIAAQARERLGYARPGETRYIVVDPQAEEIAGSVKSPRPAVQAVRPWFLIMSESIEAAGLVAPAAAPSVEGVR